MKFSGRPEIERLTGFKGRDDLVTSFYLDTDKSRLTKKEIQVSAKNLLTAARLRAGALEAGKEKKDSLSRDLDNIAGHITRHLGSLNAAGLALFSCSRRDFWLPLELPHGPRNRFIFDASFYVRPLVAILDKYRRICVLLLGRRDARWFEVSMD
jgi:peptide chain release factor subunit 1